MLNPDFSCIQQACVLIVMAYDYECFALRILFDVVNSFKLCFPVKPRKRFVKKYR